MIQRGRKVGSSASIHIHSLRAITSYDFSTHFLAEFSGSAGRR